MKRISSLDIKSRILPVSYVVWLIFLCILPMILNELGFRFDTMDVYVDPKAAPFIGVGEYSSALTSIEKGMFVWTIIHWTALCVAVGTGILSLVCYAIKREPILQIIAYVLFIVGAMDVYHTLFIDQLALKSCSAPRELVAFPWFLARCSYAALPLIGVALITFGKSTLRSTKIFQWGYSLFVFLWFVVLLIFVAQFCQHPHWFPDIVHSDRFFSKPFAAIPLALFLISGYVFWKYSRKFPSRFANGLLISLIPSIATQIYMLFGTGLFDNYSNIAYSIKILAYGTIFVALCFDYVSTYKAHKEFVSIMSHEMRNPLHVSMGITDCLKKGMDGPLNERQRLSIEKLQSSNEQILVLVNDILDMSRIEADKIQLYFSQVDVVGLLRDVIRLEEELAKQKGITLQANFNQPSLLIQGDEQKLRQIFVNLIGNAIKFTEKGGVVVSVKEEGSKVRIYIEDTGTGLSEKEMNQLFRPYYQVAKSEIVGTGIGLLIAKNFAQIHLGDISVESKKGKGSTFIVELPKKGDLHA